MQKLLVSVLVAACLAGCSAGKSNDQATGNADSDTPSASTPEATPVAIAYESLTGDPAKGERDFLQCKICHSLAEGDNRIGPSLHKILDTKAGEVPGFNFSPAMRASGLTWSDETLYRFIEDPRAMVPGTKMAFSGIRNAQTRADLIAYLKTATK